MEILKKNEIFDDNLTLRMRLRNGEEIIVVQKNEYYLVSKQIDPAPETDKKQ